jgi:hypothetical protein
MSKTIEQVIDRIKNLQPFVIETVIPDHFEMTGTVPFDMTITGGRAKFTVYAIDLVEAKDKVDEYLNQ